MNEPTITCPNCKSEIKLTESLAAPLIEATRLQFEHTIAEKEAQIAKREAAVCEQKAAIEKAREAIDEVVSQKLKAEREKIVTEEVHVVGRVVESDESFVIQGRWPDSRRGRRCGRPKTARNTIVTSCVIPAI